MAACCLFSYEYSLYEKEEKEKNTIKHYESLLATMGNHLLRNILILQSIKIDL